METILCHIYHKRERLRKIDSLLRQASTELYGLMMVGDVRQINNIRQSLRDQINEVTKTISEINKYQENGDN